MSKVGPSTRGRNEIELSQILAKERRCSERSAGGELQLLESASAVGKPGPGTLRSESHRTLFTLDNSTVKYREGRRARSGKRFVRKLSASGFLSSFCPVFRVCAGQMDYGAELNEIKVDYTRGNAVSSLERSLKIPGSLRY